MALPLLGSALGLVGDLAGNWLKGKVEKSKAEGEVKVAEAKAKAKILEKQATGEIDWDLEAIKGSQNSWKDEWLTIIFSIPFFRHSCNLTTIFYNCIMYKILFSVILIMNNTFIIIVMLFLL